MLSLYNPETAEEMELANQEAMRKAEEENQRVSMLRPMRYDPVQPEGFMGAQGMGAQGQPDYMGLAKNALSSYDKAAGTNYGGYATAATAFGKFMNWSFDKDATGGGFARPIMHGWEKAGRKTKDLGKELVFWDDIVKPAKNSDIGRKIGKPFTAAYEGVAHAAKDVTRFLSDLF